MDDYISKPDNMIEQLSKAANPGQFNKFISRYLTEIISGSPISILLQYKWFLDTLSSHTSKHLFSSKPIDPESI